jgi:hypothetical protein
MTIYVVMGSSGEYSDRYEYAVVAYKDNALAEQHVLAATQEANRIKLELNAFDWYDGNYDENEKRKQAILATSIYDANVSDDTYTGTRYYIVAVECLDTLPVED